MNPNINPIVHLALLGNRREDLHWPLGEVWQIEKSPQAVSQLVSDQGAALDAAAWLFWDPDLGTPEPETILACLALPGDVWHAGLRLGLGGLPGLINFVNPTWMLNADLNPTRVATSWRISLRACLIRTSVLRQLGSVRPDFESLEGASLEMGQRYLMSGVIPRYVPSLVTSNQTIGPAVLPFIDESLFIFYRNGRKWAYWALGRAFVNGYAGIKDVRHALRRLQRMADPPGLCSFQQTTRRPGPDLSGKRVSVLIPTLNRYDYLRRLLPQLQNQTIRPIEIIIVDQTPVAERVQTLADEFGDLPLKIHYQEYPGQCSARNRALEFVQGDYILFLDDDDEVPSDLIEAHLKCLDQFRATVSCGMDQRREPLSDALRTIRCSDVFPTNNALVHFSALESAGLFDIAYDRDWFDDADLGMRMYLNGVLMILNPEISVLHHHASSGGLRTYGIHVITFARSRGTFMGRQLPTTGEIYFCKRYFSSRQTREKLLISAAGTLSFHGNILRKAVKLLVGLCLLPHTCWHIYNRSRRADQMLQRFPQIPMLGNQQTSAVI